MNIEKLGKKCCGCGACEASCPVGSVRMETDSCGFLYPSVDHNKCVNCGLCDTRCPMLNPTSLDRVNGAYWARANNNSILLNSSSGGMFGLLALDVLSRGGVVAGAAWSEGCRGLRHVVIDDEQGLDSIMRSKYVQSEVGKEVYAGIREALRSCRPVLFCGTACQVAGVRSYLGHLADSEQFLAVDVICHGVPSPALWRRWLEHKTPGVSQDCCRVNFRSKATGWIDYSVEYECKSMGNEDSLSSTAVFFEDWYMRAFINNASLRESCFSCPFKRHCGSDITLGDFWGVKDRHPDAFDDRGVSAVLTNTERGSAAIAAISRDINIGSSSIEAIAEGNSALLHAVKPHKDHKSFMMAVETGAPIVEMMSRWDFKPTLASRVISAAKGVVKHIVRNSPILCRASLRPRSKEKVLK